MTAEWSLDPAFGSYFMVAAISLALFGLLALRPSYRPVSGKRLATLIALRGAVVLLVTIALLGPTLVRTVKRWERSTLLILFDQSRSMQLPNASSGESRWQAQAEALKEAAGAIASLSETTDVKVYGYDLKLRAAPLKDEAIVLPPAATGEQTDVSGSLYQAIDRELGKRMAAIVVLGDGAQNAFQVQVETLEVGRELARLDAPLYAAAFGPAGDTAQAPDVAIESLQDQYSVFVKNELSIDGLLKATGFANKEIPVTLTVEDAAGKEVAVQTTRVSVGAAAGPTPFAFVHAPQSPGKFKLTVEAAVQPGEMVEKNNRLSAFLTVREGGLKVLLLRGSAWWEQKFLRRSLDGSPDIELTDLWLPQNNRDSWPIDLEEQLAQEEYDVYLLADLDADAVYQPKQSAAVDRLVKAVAQGKGLMMLGGHHSFGPGGWSETPLTSVLPVELDHIRQRFDKPILDVLHLQGDVEMISTGRHFVTHLTGDADNARLWQSLPPLRGANKFLDVKPRSQTLLKTDSGDPLLVAGQFGRGRVLAFAGDTTYLWWRKGRRREHKRFWRQAVLWLAGRDEQQKDEVWVRLEQRRFNPQSEVRFTFGANSPEGDPLVDVEYDVTVTLPDGAVQQVSATRVEEGYRAEFGPASQSGEHTIGVTASRGGRELGKAAARFVVFDRDIELSNPVADPGYLSRLAGFTESGRLIAPEELPSLLEEIARRPRQEEEVQTRWQLASHWWDAWLFFLLLIGLLTAEWTLRKRWGLV